MGVKIQNLTVTFQGGVKGVDNVSFDIDSGEIVTITGPSGSGKSVICDALEGKYPKGTAGTIVLNGTSAPINSKTPYIVGWSLIEERNNMTVNDTLLTPMKGHPDRKQDKVLGQTAANQAMQLLGLQEYAQRQLRTMSGGQRLRVMIAHAMVHDANLVLIDAEKFDPRLWNAMMGELHRIAQNSRLPFLIQMPLNLKNYLLGDRVIVLKLGKLIEDERTIDLLSNPKTLIGAGLAWADWNNIMYQPFLDKINAGMSQYKDKSIIINPSAIDVYDEDDASDKTISAVVSFVGNTASHCLLTAQVGDTSITVASPSRYEYQAGDKVELLIKPSAVYIAEDDGTIHPAFGSR